MKNKICFLVLVSLINSCNISKTKKLNQYSKKEINKIVNELKLEQFTYSYHYENTNGKELKFFFIDLYNIDDSIDFKQYNNRIIELFEKSKFEIKNQSFIRIGYFKQYIPVDLFVYYDIDPKSKKIISEGTE
jgi:hypothetical protein